MKNRERMSPLQESSASIFAPPPHSIVLPKIKGEPSSCYLVDTGLDLAQIKASAAGQGLVVQLQLRRYLVASALALASILEIMAVTGQQTLSEAQRYTEKVQRARLADKALEKLTGAGNA